MRLSFENRGRAKVYAQKAPTRDGVAKILKAPPYARHNQNVETNAAINFTDGQCESNLDERLFVGKATGALFTGNGGEALASLFFQVHMLDFFHRMTQELRP
jgi:hypothetical protein